MKIWKIGIVHDTSADSLGDHGTHLAFTGLANVENRQPAAHVYHARQVLEMIYGVYRSQLDGIKVAFPLSRRGHPLDDA